MTRRVRGVALYSALGFAVFVFFLVTALSARVQYNLRLVEGSADRTRLLYLAQGGCHEVIARLNSTPGDPPSRAQPFRRSDDGVNLEVWFEADPTQPDVQHVRARAATASVQQDFEQVVTRRSVVNPVFFTTGIPGLGSPSSVLRNQAGSPNWELLPPVPNFTVDGQGNVITKPGFSITVHGVSADHEGNAFSVTSPVIDDPVFGPLFQQMMAQGMSGMGRLTELYLMYGGMVEQVGPQAAEVLKNNRPVLAKYTGRENSWRAIAPPPDVRLTSTGEFEETGLEGPGFLLQPVVGAKQNQLFIATIRPGQDSIQQLEGSTERWKTLPAPPARAYAGDQVMTLPGYSKALLGLSSSPEGTLYSQWAPTREQPNAASVYRYDAEQRSWSVLPPPPHQYGSVSIPPWQMLGQMQAGPRGTLYMTFWNPPGAPPAPDSVISYSPVTGTWSLITPPPAAYYDQTGTLVPGEQRTMIDSLGIDADGGLLVKYPQPGGPATTYRRTRDFNALPPLPRLGHNMLGQVVREPGFMAVQANVSGGGTPTSRTRYVPTASY